MKDKWQSTTSLSEFIDRFVSDHLQILSSHYPGISASIVKRQLSHSSLSEGIDSESWLKQAYLARVETPLNNFFLQMLKGKPLAHILEMCSFYRADFFITPDVLIPRSETEIMVERAVQSLKKVARAKSMPKVLDVGVGSGAIILSLLQDCPFAIQAVGVDIDSKALNIAKINEFRLHYNFNSRSSIRFILGDRLFQVDGHFDLIVSNPPYIKRRADRSSVHPQVDQFEPAIALYLQDDEYDQWFSCFFEQVFEHLHAGGEMLMEGHEDHLDELKLLAEKKGFDRVAIILDYTGRPRFLSGIRPS